MNIAVDARALLEEQKDGIASSVTNLLDNLLNIDTTNQYTFFFNKDIPANFKYKNVKCCVLKKPSIFWPQIRLSMYFLRHRNDFDVFFSPTYSLPFYFPRKKIVIIYDLAFKNFKKYFKFFDYSMLLYLTDYSIKHSDRIISISDSTKNDILKYYNVNSNKVRTIYLGYDKNYFYPRSIHDIKTCKTKYNISGDYIVHIGTLQKRKNITRLVKAFALLKKRGLKEKLVIVGKRGWLYDEIFETVRNLKLEKDILFTGYVPLEDLPFLISGSKCFILPSLYEGFGLPLLEAMACGTPVITSNVSSLPEVVGDAGMLINNPYSSDEIAERIYSLLKNNALQNQLKQKGLERAKLFSWNRSAIETLKVINSFGHE